MCVWGGGIRAYKISVCPMQYTGSSCVRISPTKNPTKTPTKPYTYSVKVTNRARKSEYTVEKLKSSSKFMSVQDLKDSLNTSLQFTPSEFGFIEPGHGLKGKHRWIHDDTDLEEMYSSFPKKRDFVLWCYTASKDDDTSRKEVGRKRSVPDEGVPTAPKPKSACLSKVSEVEVIIKDLKKRHGTDYSIEQLSMWAHVIHIGKHTSRETPPDLPFFRGNHHKKATTPSASSSMTEPSATARRQQLYHLGNV